jgi:hypothetical protein
MRYFLFLLIMLASAVMNAQDQKRVAVVLTNGNEYIGTIQSDDGREIKMNTESMGLMIIQKMDIRSMKTVESETQVVQGEFRNTGPFTTRYTFTTNALEIKKGENYTMLNLYGPEVHVALSNRFSLGLMTTWIGSPLILAAKFTIPTKNPNVNFSIGNLAATSGYIQSFRGYGDLAFANVTFGNRLNNITLAGGYFMYRGGGKENYNQSLTVVDSSSYFDGYSMMGLPKPVQGPMLSVGAIARIGAKASFVFDSMMGFFTHEYGELLPTETLQEPVYSSSDPFQLISSGVYRHEVVMRKSKSSAIFIMPGMRFQRDERKAFQFSLAGIMIHDSGETVSAPFPMCTWFYRF